MSERLSALEEAIRLLAARQHGVVSRAQLVSAGVTARMVDGRLRVGRLRRVHRGVYQVGPLTSTYAAEMAAMLASGQGSVISHASAAVLWDAGPSFRRPDGFVELTVPDDRRPRIPHVRIHRLRPIPPEEVTELHGLPLTTLARTLLDLAPVTTTREMERALAQALDRRLITPRDLRRVLERHPSRPGAPMLRALLEDGRPPTLTRSEAEQRFLALIGRAQLPKPETNVRIGEHEVDVFWRRQGLVVEIDGFAYHSSSRMFESDRHRDAVLIASGIRVIRVTWRQLEREPEALVVRIALALGPG